jgi:hypothetical protein
MGFLFLLSVGDALISERRGLLYGRMGRDFLQGLQP